MAGYKILVPSNYNDLVTALDEIGITLSKEDTIYTITFSDNKAASFNMPSDSHLAGYWIFADDDSHTYIEFNSNAAPASAGVTPPTSDTTFKLRVFIAEKEDGTLYSNNGFDTAADFSNRYFLDQVNVPNLDSSRLNNNDPNLTELKLVPLAGNFYYANTSGADRIRGFYSFYIFKHAYVNYNRWFSFGSIIRGANGESYMGWGWFLFRLGANS